MIRSTDIPLAWADLTTWSSGAHANVSGPAYCTPPQSASSLTEVIPMAFIAASSEACAAGVLAIRSGSAPPIGFIAEGGAGADAVTQGLSNAEPCRAQGRGPFALVVWGPLQPARASASASASAAGSAVTTRKIGLCSISPVNYPTEQ